MFGRFFDKRAIRTDAYLDAFRKTDAKTREMIFLRMRKASAIFCEVLEGDATFAQLKFALRPDQADMMADKALKMQAAVRNSELGTPYDELVFFLIEVSLRHKAGHKWPRKKDVEYIDQLFAIAEA